MLGAYHLNGKQQHKHSLRRDTKWSCIYCRHATPHISENMHKNLFGGLESVFCWRRSHVLCLPWGNKATRLYTRWFVNGLHLQLTTHVTYYALAPNRKAANTVLPLACVILYARLCINLPHFPDCVFWVHWIFLTFVLRMHNLFWIIVEYLFRMFGCFAKTSNLSTGLFSGEIRIAWQILIHLRRFYTHQRKLFSVAVATQFVRFAVCEMSAFLIDISRSTWDSSETVKPLPVHETKCYLTSWL